MKARIISAKYSAGPKDSAILTTVGAMKARPMVAIRPATNEPMAAVAKRRPAAAGARHLVAFERGDDRGAFARRVEQDRGGRAAIHAAVVDAGEHDERAGRVELVGDGQQQARR
jgi:prephenate dehydrogenase